MQRHRRAGGDDSDADDSIFSSDERLGEHGSREPEMHLHAVITATRRHQRRMRAVTVYRMARTPPTEAGWVWLGTACFAAPRNTTNSSMTLSGGGGGSAGGVFGAGTVCFNTKFQ